MDSLKRTWPLVVLWALVFGLILSLIADWGEWGRLPLNTLWRVLIAAVGALIGLVLNYFAGTYVGMSTNVIESTGIVRFTGDTYRKIENTFVFVGALVGAILAAIFIL